MRPGLEAEAVEEVFAVVFLPIERPGSATVIPLVGVEELDGFLSAGELWVFLLEECEPG